MYVLWLAGMIQGCEKGICKAQRMNMVTLFGRKTWVGRGVGGRCDKFFIINSSQCMCGVTYFLTYIIVYMNTYKLGVFNPLSPNSDQHQSSPCNINAYSTP